MRALDIITDAYERLNRLSPGETLGAEETAFAFRRLNTLADELSARQQFLYRDVLTSAAQTGHITLAAGSWAAIPVGAHIISLVVDGDEAWQLTMQQYAAIHDKTQAGSPNNWAHDGAATVYLYPVATGQTVQLQTRVGVAEFADTTTDYTAPPGWSAALGASLAVRLATPVLGGVSPALLRDEKRAMEAVRRYVPRILDVYSYTATSAADNILTG